MTLTELKYIVALAREKHFGRAAEACFVSQPTLSVGIKNLEEELQVKLFERSANEVAVTPLGEDIIRQAQSVLEQAANIKELAKRGKDPLAGPLRLGVIYTIAPYLLPESVRQGQRLTGMTSTQASFPIAPSMFRFRQRGSSGVWVSDLLPRTAGIADRLCFIRSMHTEAINHDPAITFFCSGNQVAGRPSMVRRCRHLCTRTCPWT